MRVLYDLTSVIGMGILTGSMAKRNLGLTAADRFSLTMDNLNFRAALRGEPEVPVNAEVPALPFKPADRVFAPEKYSFKEGEVTGTDRSEFSQRITDRRKAYGSAGGR